MKGYNAMNKRKSINDIESSGGATPISIPILKSTAPAKTKTKTSRTYSIEDDIIVPLAMESAKTGLDKGEIVCRALRAYLKLEEQ